MLSNFEPLLSHFKFLSSHSMKHACSSYFTTGQLKAWTWLRVPPKVNVENRLLCAILISQVNFLSTGIINYRIGGLIHSKCKTSALHLTCWDLRLLRESIVPCVTLVKKDFTVYCGQIQHRQAQNQKWTPQHSRNWQTWTSCQQWGPCPGNLAGAIAFHALRDFSKCSEFQAVIDWICLGWRNCEEGQPTRNSSREIETKREVK